MLTQSLSTSVVGNKISPVAYPAPDSRPVWCSHRARGPHRHRVFLQER